MRNSVTSGADSHCQLGVRGEDARCFTVWQVWGRSTLHNFALNLNMKMRGGAPQGRPTCQSQARERSVQMKIFFYLLLFLILLIINRSVRLSFPRVIPHPPTPFVLLAWWTSSNGTEAASGCPPDSRRPPPAGGIRPSWPGFLASPGRRPSLPGPLSPRYPTSRSPAMVRTGRKGFIPRNKLLIKKQIIHLHVTAVGSPRLQSFSSSLRRSSRP